MIKNTKKVTIQKIKPAFVDKRGAIIDILEKVPVKHIGLITFAKNIVRANHYHKNQTQYTYVLEGEIKLVTQHFKGGKKTTTTTKPGDFVTIPPGFIHAYLATKKSVVIVLTDYSRDMKSYEDDTFRVKIV